MFFIYWIILESNLSGNAVVSINSWESISSSYWLPHTVYVMKSVFSVFLIDFVRTTTSFSLALVWMAWIIDLHRLQISEDVYADNLYWFQFNYTRKHDLLNQSGWRMLGQQGAEEKYGANSQIRRHENNMMSKSTLTHDNNATEKNIQNQGGWQKNPDRSSPKRGMLEIKRSRRRRIKLD